MPPWWESTSNADTAASLQTGSPRRARYSRFRLGSALPKITRKKPTGTTISFKLSEPATASLAFSQPKIGRKVKGRCVAPSRKNRNKRRCTRQVTVGSLSFNAHKGTNKVRFQGRLSKKKSLKPGRYVLTINATDSAGNKSKPKTLRLTVLPKR